MLDHLVFVETLALVIAPSRSAMRDDDGAAFAAELGGVIADVAEALHDDAFALEAGCRGRAASCSAWLLHASRSAKNSPRPVASLRPRTPPWVTGLPVTQPSASSWPGIERRVGVGDPRHLALAGAVVGRRDVDAGADEVLLDQFVRVAPGDALEFVDRVVASDRCGCRPWRRRTARRRWRTCRS